MSPVKRQLYPKGNTMTDNLPAAAPDTNGARWLDFVELVANGDAPVDAAAALGFSQPKLAARELLAMPVVRKALVAATDARLMSEAAPEAMRVVLEVLRDPDCPASVRGKMAVAVLDRVSKATIDPAKQAKSPEDMTAEELRDLVAELEVKADRSTRIVET